MFFFNGNGRPSQNRACRPSLFLGSGGPAQPAEIALCVGGIAQHVDAFQSPAPQHAASLVTERLKTPLAVIAAHPAGTCMDMHKCFSDLIQLHIGS